MTEHAQNLVLECLLKEADLLQSEMDKRLERHHQSFYICMIVIAAVITGYATSLLGDFQKENRFLVLISFLPWLTTPLAAMFFDDELLRAVTDVYIHDHLVFRIRELLRSVGYREADDAFHSTLTSRFAHIKRLNQNGHTHIRIRVRAGTIRRYLFAIPFLISASAYSTLGYRAYRAWFDHVNAYVAVASAALVSMSSFLYSSHTCGMMRHTFGNSYRAAKALKVPIFRLPQLRQGHGSPRCSRGRKTVELDASGAS